MARLLSWPIGLRWNRWKPLNGPQSISAGVGTTIGDVTQTVASPFGARYLQFSFPPMRGRVARRARGLVESLHMGANAVRVSICDWDGLTFSEAGVTITEQQKRTGIPWSNGMPWANGKNWKITKPNVAVAAPAAEDATIIKLQPSFWGHDLGIGDWIGFFPLHFGLYGITEVVADGEYRIWPPLRKAVLTDDFATLYPVMAMRLLSSNLPDAERGPAFLEGLTISLFEVFDADARQYFTD
ncbi:hypothetical protein ABK249_02695 [Neorhizobium sp. Rsf11]|uniref:Uncharacterized protein n=1 Tax=Neorhizobium phenanthreniclasticum TaxID=3157917 RepID=A0ABV0LW38_9HYPH